MKGERVDSINSSVTQSNFDESNLISVGVERNMWRDAKVVKLLLICLILQHNNYIIYSICCGTKKENILIIINKRKNKWNLVAYCNPIKCSKKMYLCTQ